MRAHNGRHLKTLASATVLVALAAAGLMQWALHGLPLDRAIATGLPPVVLTAADAQPPRDIQAYKIANATRKQFPDDLVNAVLSIEDRRFYYHWGFDPYGIVRALSRNGCRHHRARWQHDHPAAR